MLAIGAFGIAVIVDTALHERHRSDDDAVADNFRLYNMLAKGAELDRFMRHLSHWSWVHRLYQLSDKHLLIADDFFLDRLHGAREKPLAIKTSRIAGLDDAVTDNIQKILVFCQVGELQLVRSLQQKFPHVDVTSGTYGFAITDRARMPKLFPYQAPKAEVKPGQVVLLSPPYVEAEFVARSMAENALPYCHEYLGRPFALWLKHHKNFQITRFFDSAMQNFGTDGHLPTLLQTDVLRSVFKNTSFSFDKLLKYLKKLDVKVIMVRRDDKIMQLVTAQLLERTAERSVWTNKPKKTLGTLIQDDDLDQCLDRYVQVAEDSALLDQIAAADLTVHQLTLEGFIENQAEGLQGIADFLEMSLPQPATTLDYFSAYENAPDVMPGAAMFKHAMIDKTGLHLL